MNRRTILKMLASAPLMPNLNELVQAQMQTPSLKQEFKPGGVKTSNPIVAVNKVMLGDLDLSEHFSSQLYGTYAPLIKLDSGRKIAGPRECYADVILNVSKLSREEINRIKSAIWEKSFSQQEYVWLCEMPFGKTTFSAKKARVTGCSVIGPGMSILMGSTEPMPITPNIKQDAKISARISFDPYENEDNCLECARVEYEEF